MSSQLEQILVIMSHEPAITGDMVSNDTYWMQRIGGNLWVDMRMKGDNRPTMPVSLFRFIEDYPQDYYYVKHLHNGYAKVLPLEQEELPWKAQRSD